MTEYNQEQSIQVGECEISITDCPKIWVRDLTVQVITSFATVDPVDRLFNSNGVQIGSGPPQIKVKFTAESLAIDSKQSWFFQFNSPSQIGNHLAREKLVIYVRTSEYILHLIGYLKAEGAYSNSSGSGLNIQFEFNGVMGDDISFIPQINNQENIDNQLLSASVSASASGSPTQSLSPSPTYSPSPTISASPGVPMATVPVPPDTSLPSWMPISNSRRNKAIKRVIIPKKPLAEELKHNEVNKERKITF
jgi:hypothetical protein